MITEQEARDGFKHFCPDELKNLSASVAPAIIDIMKAIYEHPEDKRLNFGTALGEIKVNNVKYQVLISLVANKDQWLDPAEIAAYNVTEVTRP